MQVLKGKLERYDEKTNDELMHQTTYEWPHAFTRFEADSGEILSRYGSNHIHAIPGDHVADLRQICDLLDVDYDGLGAAR
jgi:L-fucose isomerase